MEKSLFMMDKSRTDNKESVIDYMLSWTLRMSSRSGECKNSSVQNYCERILSKLLFNDFDKIKTDNKSIESVETWKQWKKIDLLAEIELIDNEGNKSSYALLIEDKAYSSIHDDQLKRYKKIFEEEYKDSKFENNLHYAYFTIKERTQIVEDEKLCNEAGFQAYTMEEIRDYLWPTPSDLIPTGNDIFDEFWIKNWG